MNRNTAHGSKCLIQNSIVGSCARARDAIKGTGTESRPGAKPAGSIALQRDGKNALDVNAVDDKRALGGLVPTS